MIKIRYACLPEGLHATAVARGRHATIYLRPGLGLEQRRDALERLRRNARIGYAPPLPAMAVARAVAADRVSGTLRSLLAAVACHPLGTLGLAGALAGAAVSYMTLMSCPVPAGNAVPVASLPGAGDGESVAAGQLGSGLPAAAVPLGIKQRPWTVPEARPRHHAHHDVAWPPAPPAPRRAGSRHGWWWLRHRPGWQQRLAQHRGGRPGWPPARHWRGHPWDRRHQQGGHEQGRHWQGRPGQGRPGQGGHGQGGHGQGRPEQGRPEQGSQQRRDSGRPRHGAGRRWPAASRRQDAGWPYTRHERQAYGWRLPQGRPAQGLLPQGRPAQGRPPGDGRRPGPAGYRRQSAWWPQQAGQQGAPPQITGGQRE